MVPAAARLGDTDLHATTRDTPLSQRTARYHNTSKHVNRLARQAGWPFELQHTGRGTRFSPLRATGETRHRISTTIGVWTECMRFSRKLAILVLDPPNNFWPRRAVGRRGQ